MSIESKLVKGAAVVSIGAVGGAIALESGAFGSNPSPSVAPGNRPNNNLSFYNLTIDGQGAAASLAPDSSTASRAPGVCCVDNTKLLDIAVTPSSDIILGGLPTKVDASNVDTAKGGFKNTIGLGSQQMFAEPGGLHVGPTFNKQQMEGSNGAITYLADHQIHLTEDQDYNLVLKQGGIMKVAWQEGDIQVGENHIFHFPEIQGNMHLIYFNGMNAEGTGVNACGNPTGGDLPVKLTGFVPGSGEEEDYPPLADGQPLPFVSENSVKNDVAEALKNGYAKTVTITVINMNTLAFSSLFYDGQNWKAIASNWWDSSMAKTSTNNAGATVFAATNTNAYDASRKPSAVPTRMVSQTQPSYRGSLAKVGSNWRA